MENKEAMEGDTRRLTEAVLFLSIVVIILLGLLPLV